MPLDPKDGIGSYIKDFKKSKAPQFKGKSDDKKRDMAIAAYLDAKRGPQESKLAGSSLKLFGQKNRSFSELSMRLKTKAKVQRALVGPSKKARPDWMRDTGKGAKELDKKAKGIVALKKSDQAKMSLAKKALNVKEGSYKVSIAGLPDMYMDDKTPGALLQKLRKIVKQPSLIQDVERTTDAKKKKAFRQKAQGREVTEYKYDYGTPESVKLMKKQTPGQNEAKDPGEYDYEGDMAKNQLKTMIDAAQELHDMLSDNENMPEWVQSKITKATDYIDTVRDYLKSEKDKSVDEGTDAPKGPESYEAQYKRRLVKTTDPEHKEKGYKYRIKGKKDSSLTKKLYKTKPGQAEFNKQMKRIAGHEFG